MKALTWISTGVMLGIITSIALVYISDTLARYN